MKIITRIKSIPIKLIKKYKKFISNDNNIYLIYTMGKVGSSTIYKTLKKEKPYSNIFHVHFLSKNWLNNLLPNGDSLFQTNIKIGNDILDFIEKNPKKKIKIITLVREPIMRSISNLFQNWQHLYDNITEINNAELQNHLENINHDYTLNWFDTEFKEYLNIDIYSLPFDKEKGFQIYKFKNFDILCVKLEALNNIGQASLKIFLNKDITLESDNISTDKLGKEQYSFLKEHIKLPKTKLLKLYQSKYMTHFYTKSEIDKFIEKWKS